MGDTLSKNNGGNYYSEKEVTNLKDKVKLLQEEIKGIVGEREKEIMVVNFKKADWKQERKKLKEEVMQLKKMVEEKEEKIKEMKEMGLVVGDSKKEWELMGTKLLFEKMKEERARRDEAVEKWKQLYLAIKTELDDLIQRTYDGEGLYWKAEENDGHMELLKRELEEKEGVIKTLKAQLDSMEHEKNKKEREFDLLKQSLRIINGMKHSTIKTKEKLMKSKQGR